MPQKPHAAVEGASHCGGPCGRPTFDACMCFDLDLRQRLGHWCRHSFVFLIKPWYVWHGGSQHWSGELSNAGQCRVQESFCLQLAMYTRTKKWFNQQITVVNCMLHLIGGVTDNMALLCNTSINCILLPLH